MSQQIEIASPEKTKQRHGDRRESRPDSTQSLQGGLHPILQLQRMIGNRRVAQLMQAKRLTPDKRKPVQAKFLTETSREPLQRQPDTEEDETALIQAKSADALPESFEAGADVATQVSQSEGRGSPLPDAVRTSIEPRFGVAGNVAAGQAVRALQREPVASEVPPLDATGAPVPDAGS